MFFYLVYVLNYYLLLNSILHHEMNKNSLSSETIIQQSTPKKTPKPIIIL